VGGFDENGDWTNQVFPENGTVNFLSPPTPQPPPYSQMTAARAAPLILKEIG
jgi:hypothetical protein